MKKKTTNTKTKGEVILSCKDLAYRYEDAAKDEYVFKDLNFDFEAGKVYAIRGKSGSGKTTLLSLISGLETKYEGDVIFEDTNLRDMNLDTYRNSSIGIVFQSYNLLVHLTALENVILSMDINHTKNINKKERALELINSVGLDSSKADRRVLRLSGGEQQRVAIARSLSYNPKMIIADEPTGNLDKETEDEIMNIFKRLAHEDGKCVIIVTHSKNVADNCDVVYELASKNKKEK